MKKIILNLLLLFSILGVTSCQEVSDDNSYMGRYEICMFISSSDTDDFVRDSLPIELLSNRYEYSLSVKSSDDIFLCLAEQVRENEKNNDKWIEIHKVSGVNVDKKSLSFCLYCFDINGTPPSAIYQWYCPTIFGDEEKHEVVLNFDYTDSLNWTERVTSGTIDGKPLSVQIIETSENHYFSLLEYVIE